MSDSSLFQIALLTVVMSSAGCCYGTPVPLLQCFKIVVLSTNQQAAVKSYNLNTNFVILRIMTKKATYSADNVAKYLIYLASQELVGDNQEREGITNLKLQKVLYFVQAYYLAKLGHPLFSDKIEAWEYGPVIPTVYRKYRANVSNPIILDEDKSTLSEEDKKNVQKIWETFGGYSASRLVDITHAHSPWKDASQTASKVITAKSLREYYTPLLNK
tara:strand:- start:677 stop:1324 length:648 start_codon:yes stop_codon:yes gene_type:complete